MELNNHKGQGIRFRVHLSAPKGGLVQMLQDPDGEWVSHEEYLRKCGQLNSTMDLVGALMVALDDVKANLERMTEKSSCQAEAINAYDKKLNEAKAEVERLTSDIQMEKENEDRIVREWQKANNEVYGLKTQVAALIDNQTRLKAEIERLTAFTTRTIIPNEELQAQVERLTKAGDAMLSEWSSGDEKDAKNFLKASVIWNAAKGVQS